MEHCGSEIAAPLTTADQYDLSRALVESITYSKSCAEKQKALVAAVKVRQEVMKSIKSQLEK